MNDAQVGHFDDAAKLGGRCEGDRREHRCHGIVDPHVNWAEGALELGCRALDLIGIGHIRLERHGTTAEPLGVSYRTGQTRAAAREQTQTRPAFRVRLCDGSAHTSRGACNHHNRMRHVPM